MHNTDLTNCDREPIHIPGKIQSHGFLIAINPDFRISYCSENVDQFLNVKPAEILDQDISILEPILQSGKKLPGYLRQFILMNDQPGEFRQQNVGVGIGNANFSIVVNKAGDHFLMEFEPESTNLQSDVQHLIGRSLSEMLADKQLDTLLANTAQQIRQIIDYNRVMVYKFHPDGHGEVVAESKNDDIESWLGLHYPATDIPKQARELYKKNLVRLIADVRSKPSDLMSFETDEASQALDLTNSTLRAVSPMHIQYLINMGVASSFSVSILDQDNLWGLIACHNYKPRFINFRQRESAKLIGQVLSSAISFRQQEENQQKSAKVRSALEQITRDLLRNVPVQVALFSDEHHLQDAIESTGAALYFEQELYTSGNTPNPLALKALINWLVEKDMDIYHTAALSDEYPEGLAYKQFASGLLACRLSPELKEYVLWFRPEVSKTVKWAGNIDKLIQTDSQGFTHISPRNSFQEWSQQVDNTAQAWEQYEVEAALLLKDEINYSISRKATELRLLNEKLREAYAELDTFSYTISHDLKNPLTTIKSYAQLIQRQADPDSKIRHMADRILEGSGKMQNMIEDVLQYSKAGQTKISRKPIDMEKLINDLSHDLIVASNNPVLKIEVKNTPGLYGDETMIMQVFSNLIGNAVKYSAKTATPVVTINGELIDDYIVRYAVSDNGIGIPYAEQHAIFELFSRAEDSKSFDGTGVGLAIVKRILEKHHGDIAVESEVGKGSTFYATFDQGKVQASLN